MTAKQMKTFWPAFNSACRELGLVDKSAREEYRHAVMWETAHARHLSEVTATTGFEAVMTRLHADAGDIEAASRMAIGDERRLAAMIDDCARQVFELSGKEGDRVAYARAILKQSGVEAEPRHASDWWLDYPDEIYTRVSFILDTYRRRLVHRRQTLTSERVPVRYHYGRTWK